MLSSTCKPLILVHAVPYLQQYKQGPYKKLEVKFQNIQEPFFGETALFKNISGRLVCLWHSPIKKYIIYTYKLQINRSQKPFKVM